MNITLAEPLALRNLAMFKSRDAGDKISAIATLYNLSTSQVRRILKGDRPLDQSEYKLCLVDNTHSVPLGNVNATTFAVAAKFIERRHRPTIEKLELRHQWRIVCDNTGHSVRLSELADL